MHTKRIYRACAAGVRHVFVSEQEAACRGSLYAAQICPLGGVAGQVVLLDSIKAAPTRRFLLASTAINACP